MSVILLTTLPSTLASIKQRDSDAINVRDTFAILGKKDAVLSNETINSLCAESYIERPDIHTRRTTVHIGNGWILRVMHSSGLMGPSRFLNIAPNAFTAPWGIWILFRLESDYPPNVGFVEREQGDAMLHMSFSSFDEAVAIEAYEAAKCYTYRYSEHNRRIAKALNYDS